MSRRKWYAVAVVVTAFMLGLAFGLMGGQQGAPPTQAGLPSAGGVEEGVQVHGHWTMEVRDPDGSLVSHDEFENDLEIPGGREALGEILLGDWTAGDWAISLGTGSLGPFGGPGIPPSRGYIIEPCEKEMDPNYFDNLNVSFNYSTGVIAFTGAAQAAYSGNISDVETTVGGCTNVVPPSQCNCTSSYWDTVFTRTFLPQEIELAEDQWIIVEVDISFD